jgi:hypothetical protein
VYSAGINLYDHGGEMMAKVLVDPEELQRHCDNMWRAWAHLTTYQHTLSEMTVKVLVDPEELQRLQDRDNTLSALEMQGVDNWSGYGEHYEMLKEYYPETYRRIFGDE